MSVNLLHDRSRIFVCILQIVSILHTSRHVSRTHLCHVSSTCSAFSFYAHPCESSVHFRAQSSLHELTSCMTGTGLPFEWFTSLSFVNNSLGEEIIYATSAFPGSVHMLSRDPASGALTLQSSVSDGDAEGIIDSLAGARSVALSPDGEFLYVCAFSDSALTEFRRAGNGSLTYTYSLRAGERTRSNFVPSQRHLLTTTWGDADTQPALGAVHVTVGSTELLVVASGALGAHVSVWQRGMFAPLHRLNNSGEVVDEFAVDVATILVQTRRFVFVANAAVSASSVYEWTGRGFLYKHALKDIGRCVQI